MWKKMQTRLEYGNKGWKDDGVVMVENGQNRELTIYILNFLTFCH